MKTREQWVEEVLSRIRTMSDCNILYEYEKDIDQIQALLLEVPDLELTTCRHCGFRVKLNEAPQPENKGE